MSSVIVGEYKDKMGLIPSWSWRVRRWDGIGRFWSNRRLRKFSVFRCQVSRILVVRQGRCRGLEMIFRNVLKTLNFVSADARPNGAVFTQ